MQDSQLVENVSANMQMQFARKKAYRYPGPDSFRDDETDSRIFFGREEETAEIFNRLLSNRLLVLYAKSGLGKTSLLQAGLFPKLRAQDLLPIRLRFNRRNISLIAELQNAVGQTCKELDIVYSAGEGDSYWEYFKTVLFSKGERFLTPVLILDQFEEVFTLQSEEFRRHLGQQLAGLVSGQAPDAVRERIRAGDKSLNLSTVPMIRILISLREDSVGALQEFAVFMPGILSQRFRLTQLDRERARIAIFKPAQIVDSEMIFHSRPFSYQTKTADMPDCVEAILDYLQDKRGNIEPFQLQLLCRHIELKVIENQEISDPSLVVDVQTYLGGRVGMEKVINGFYLNAMASLNSWAGRRKARNLCETGLLNPEGRRESLSAGQIKRSFGLGSALLLQLVEKKILRREERLDDFAYELSHDSLALAVFKNRRVKVKRKWQLIVATVILLSTGTAVWQYQLFKTADNSANANQDAYKQLVKELLALNKINEPKMIRLQAGHFQMGSSSGNTDETPVHQVTLNAFAIGVYEVTFEEYDQFAVAKDLDLPPDAGWGRGRQPVINVSWENARDYAAWLSHKTGKHYYLPSEAQWEYAARAGSTGDYSWESGKAEDFAWFDENSGNVTHTVGLKKPNAFGLFDMSGNVWEWVADCYHENYQNAPTDGKVWEEKNNGDCARRVVRGGSWSIGLPWLRSADRGGSHPDDRFSGLGFRLAQD